MKEHTKGCFAKEMDDPYYIKDPKIFELYSRCLPPEESYFYFPKGNEIIVIDQKNFKETDRKIYYNVQMLDQEVRYLNELKNMIKNKNEIQLPEFCDDFLLLRFVWADQLDLSKVYKRMQKYFQFSNKTYPILIHPKSKLIEILNKGFMYVYGRDRRYRPILIFRGKEFLKYENVYSVEEVVEAGCFLGQFILNHMLIPGQIERWDLIVDLKGVSLMNLPEHIKKLLPVMNDAFFSRAENNYILGMGFFLRFIYKLACNFLHKSTVLKNKVLSKKDYKEMFKEIRRDNIEEVFGGTAPNVPMGTEHGLFPPHMPSSKFLLENEKPEDILISEDEYIQKYKNGKLYENWVCPSILKKMAVKKDKKSTKEVLNEFTEESTTKTSLFLPFVDSKNFQKSNTINTVSFMSFKSEKIVLKDKLKKFHEKNIKQVKTFAKDGWDNNPEDMNEHKKYNHYNIMNEINSLIKKRNDFFENINIINKPQYKKMISKIGSS